MLAKLAFVMQRLKKYLKNFCHDQQRWGGGGDNFKILWGDTAVMRGDIELMGGPPSPPPTRENPGLLPLPIKNRFKSFSILDVCQTWISKEFLSIDIRRQATLKYVLLLFWACLWRFFHDIWYTFS